MSEDLTRHFRAGAERAGIALDAERLAALVEQAEGARAAAVRLEKLALGDCGPAGGPLVER
ncbi:MAG: hypothetical protein HYU88_10760 [Chloroflexi bacterium]|nr:hypothetical protein [Chloroflexota bacterium]MBI4506397.1 hypothetical protein [Chloroflexota bacterium]